MTNFKIALSLALASTLSGCAATPHVIPPVVDKGMPETSLTLADLRLGRHASSHIRAGHQTYAVAQEPTAQVYVPRANAGLSVAPLVTASVEQNPKPTADLVAPIQPVLTKPAPAPAGAAQPITNIQPAPVVVDVQMRIHKLTEGYIQGNLEDAYELAKLLAKQGRSEEADVVLDYASRQAHVPSMKLYAERLSKNGQEQKAQEWLSKASQ